MILLHIVHNITPTVSVRERWGSFIHLIDSRCRFRQIPVNRIFLKYFETF